MPCEIDGLAGAVPWAVAAAPLLPGVIDVGEGIRAKARHGVPLWRAHADHLYQRLTKAGWSHPAVAVRYAALAACAVVLVAWVAPRLGLAACLVTGLLVLGWHRFDGLRRTRHLPWSSLDA